MEFTRETFWEIEARQESSISDSDFEAPYNSSPVLSELQTQDSSTPDSSFDAPYNSSPPLSKIQAQEPVTSDTEETPVLPPKRGGGKTRGPQPDLQPWWAWRARSTSPGNDDIESQVRSEAGIDPSIVSTHLDMNKLEPKLGFYNLKHNEEKGYDPFAFEKDRTMAADWLAHQSGKIHREFVDFVTNINSPEAKKAKNEFENIIHVAHCLRDNRVSRVREENYRRHQNRYEAGLRLEAKKDISAALTLHLLLTEPEEYQAALSYEDLKLVRHYEQLYCWPMGEREFMSKLLQDLEQEQADMVFLELRGYRFHHDCTGGKRPEAKDREKVNGRSGRPRKVARVDTGVPTDSHRGHIRTYDNESRFNDRDAETASHIEVSLNTNLPARTSNNANSAHAPRTHRTSGIMRPRYPRNANSSVNVNFPINTNDSISSNASIDADMSVDPNGSINANVSINGNVSINLNTSINSNASTYTSVYLNLENSTDATINSRT